MVSALAFAIVAIPLAWHVATATLVVLDARAEGMSPRKWGLIALLVPIFGPFAYLLERSEQYYDPESDPFREGTVFEFHESRADDLRPRPGGPPEEAPGGPPDEASGRPSSGGPDDGADGGREGGANGRR